MSFNEQYENISGIKKILDDAPFAVYVNSLDNWEILYSNKKATQLNSKNPNAWSGVCYKAMGFDKPCPYCKINEMKNGEFLTREFYNPILKRTYQLSGMLIDWDGIPAHIEYITDITEKKLAEEADKSLSEERINLLRNIPGGLCVYRFDGKTITPVFHNDAFYKIMGYSVEHIFQTQTETSNLGVHPDDVDELNRKIFNAIKEASETHHIYRVYNDRLSEYRWIRLDGSVKRQSDGSSFLYGVYTDVNEIVLLEKKLASEKERMQDIVNAIPGGVAIYKITDKFETVYFTKGVPALTGYSVEEYNEIIKEDAIKMIYRDDVEKVVTAATDAIMNKSVLDIEFRKQHRNGSIVWVHVQARQIGEEDGYPLLQCVFHNITNLIVAQQELDHIVNSIPGGIAVLKPKNNKYVPQYYTDGVRELAGYDGDEFYALVKNDVFNLVFKKDKNRVKTAIAAAIQKNATFDLSYRINHKSGHPVWVHLNGRKMNTDEANPDIYVVLTGMSEETKLYQSIANETADGLYVIEKGTYELLYVNESANLFMNGETNPIGKKCYEVLHNRKTPCEFCSLKTHKADNEKHEMAIPGSDKIYETRFSKIDWNGIPAYIKSVNDVTEEALLMKEKKRLENYFQSIINNLPGGSAVVRFDEKQNKLIPEFISQGFASMCGMTIPEAWDMYQTDACAGAHPDDVEGIFERITSKMKANDSSRFESIYRLRKKDGTYIWVKNATTVINSDNEHRIYASYNDISHEIAEQDRLRAMYDDMIFQHLQIDDANVIVSGHSDITANRILQLSDKTGNNLSKTCGKERDAFWKEFSQFIPDEAERTRVTELFKNDSMLKSYSSSDTKREADFYVELPNEATGRYVHALSTMIVSPDSGNIVNVITVTDVTEQRMSDQLLHCLSGTNYDFIADADFKRDAYKLMYFNKDVSAVPNVNGSYTKQALRFLNSLVVPKDRDVCEQRLQIEYIRKRLAKENSFSFHYTIIDKNGEYFTKNMVVFYIDKRLERVCLARTDITDSVREQRQFLNILAYTFDLTCFIDIHSGGFTMHTRETVLKDLPPYRFDDYNAKIKKITELYIPQRFRENMLYQLSLDTVISRLEETPGGYEFTYLYAKDGVTANKQVNVIWGDDAHRTICMVRADVTDILAAEHRSKEHLKNALNIAREASKAKTEFLSSMSHDIRTPMNAIIGMTELALSDRENPAQIDESLTIIKSSSEHLLHLINNILDMSRIESGKMSLLKEQFNFAAELEKMTERASVLAENKKQCFKRSLKVRHYDCLADVTKLRQIVDNLIGNAIKFTPEGGCVSLSIEELNQKNDAIGWYRFTVSDTGIGIDEEHIKHIFEPFYRTSSPENNNIEGTGLGLSIVKNIVDYKGGILNVKSELKKGSTFTVDLPLMFAKATQKPKPAEKFEDDTARELRGVKVLLVEDNPVNQLVAKRMLEKMQAQVTVAQNGAEGVKEFLENADGFDVVCMDIQMPEMDGYQASKEIRNSTHPHAKSVPIVAMTANAFAGDIQRCLESGMNAHISKPIEPGKLYQILKNFVKRP